MPPKPRYNADLQTDTYSMHFEDSSDLHKEGVREGPAVRDLLGCTGQCALLLFVRLISSHAYEEYKLHIGIGV